MGLLHHGVKVAIDFGRFYTMVLELQQNHQVENAAILLEKNGQGASLQSHTAYI